MNWAILMLGGPIVLATVYYLLGGRNTYMPPEQTVDNFIDRYQVTTESSKKEMSSGIAEEKAADETLTEQSVGSAEKRDCGQATTIKQCNQ
jgi:hypothetical protein